MEKLIAVLLRVLQGTEPFGGEYRLIKLRSQEVIQSFSCKQKNQESCFDSLLTDKA